MQRNDRADDTATIAALYRGDEAAFASLVTRYQPSLLRVERAWAHDPASAAEVVQDAWLAALEFLDRFEARSSLRTWLYGILVNVTRTHARSLHRMVRAPGSRRRRFGSRPRAGARPPAVRRAATTDRLRGRDGGAVLHGGPGR